MPQQQQSSAPIIIDVPGHGSFEFPAGTSDDVMRAAIMKEIGTQKPIASGEANVAGRSTIENVGLGAAKSLGRTAADWVAFVNGNPGASLANVIPDLQAEGAAQKWGGVIPDIAQAAATGGGQLLTTPIRAVANYGLRKAMPGGTKTLADGTTQAVAALTKQGATQLFKRGAYLPTTKNAAMVAAEAKATPVQSSTVRQVGRNLVPIWTKPSKLQPAADALEVAANTPAKPVNYMELAAIFGGGYAFNSPKIAAALGAMRILNRPMVKAGMSGAANAAAPYANALGVGGGINIASEVFDELERQRRGGR